jgi:hypothetical protein
MRPPLYSPARDTNVLKDTISCRICALPTECVRRTGATAAFDETLIRTDKCRRYEWSAGRAVSVPLGTGANERSATMSMTSIRASDTALVKAGVERGV